MIMRMKIKHSITKIGGYRIQNINKRRFKIWKKNALLNLINNQPDIDKIYLYAKDPYEAKYQLLINTEKKQD